MDLMKEGGFTSHHPLLQGWNSLTRMRAFMKSIVEKAHRSILQGWKLPTKTNAEGKIVPKSKAE